MNIVLDIVLNIALITSGASADRTTTDALLITDRDRTSTPIYVLDDCNQLDEMSRFGVDVDEKSLEKFGSFV